MLASTVIIMAAGCNKAVTSTPGPAPMPSSTSPPADTNPATQPTQVLYASGWQEITILANWAMTKVDAAAHFSTSRNGCGKEEYGAIDLALWNKIADGANNLSKTEPLPQSDEYCIPIFDGNKMDGTVELILTPALKKPLFEARYDKICTTIANKELAENFLHIINEIVIMADKEGCPNGWGSG